MIKKIFSVSLGLMLIIFLVLLVNAEVISDETYTNFIINTGGITCSDNGRFWIDSKNFNPPRNLDSINDCFKSADIIGSQNCCPLGYECKQGSLAGQNFCVYNSKEFCHELGADTEMTIGDRKAECESYTSSIAKNSVHTARGLSDDKEYCGSLIGDSFSESGNTCWKYVTCACEWDDTQNLCNAVSNEEKSCDDGSVPVVKGTCTYTLTEWIDKCDEQGIITASWQADNNNYEGECTDKNMQIPCEDIVKLGFFNWFNFVIAIIILIIIYYVHIRHKK